MCESVGLQLKDKTIQSLSSSSALSKFHKFDLVNNLTSQTYQKTSGTPTLPMFCCFIQAEAQHSWPHRPKRQNPRRCRCLGGFSQATEYLPGRDGRMFGSHSCVKAELATQNEFGEVCPNMLRISPCVYIYIYVYIKI